MLLHAAGVPVPNGRVVETVEDALKAAEEIGSAVVIKPLDGNQGKGVAVNISTPEQITRAVNNAALISDEVIVERYLPG
ncbi:acetate--CoA ligase family protein, partial [Acinetobacter baumannii]